MAEGGASWSWKVSNELLGWCYVLLGLFLGLCPNVWLDDGGLLASLLATCTVNYSEPVKLVPVPPLVLLAFGCLSCGFTSYVLAVESREAASSQDGNALVRLALVKAPRRRRRS
jgi:hypothetical protein